MKNYYIAKEDNNWADEISIESILLFKSEKGTAKAAKKELIDGIEKSYGEYPFMASIGTNEEIEFEDRDSLESTIEVKMISKEEYDTLKKFLGERFGVSAVL